MDPPIPQGTLAEVAVLKTFAGTYCKNHLLRSMKTRFQVTHDMHPRHASTTHTQPTHDMHPRQKWTNKTLAVECIEDLYTWIREKPASREERIRYLKSLRSSPEPDVPYNDEEPDDAEPTADGIKCQSLVIEAMLKYSKGREGAKVFPYGEKASKSTEEFCKIPSPILSITLACMYPFIIEEKDTHDDMLKRAQYPIKQLWPMAVLKRYMNFNDAFCKQRNDMMDNYEASGGAYHGDDDAGDSASESSAVEAKEYEDMTLGCDKDF